MVAAVPGVIGAQFLPMNEVAQTGQLVLISSFCPVFLLGFYLGGVVVGMLLFNLEAVVWLLLLLLL